MTFQFNPLGRFSGIDFLFDRCKDLSVLDIGCGDGLISYELVRNGANYVHGVDNNTAELAFCEKLFRRSGIKRFFLEMDVTKDYFIPSLNRHPFNKTYDIVLFMSVYNKICTTTNKHVLNELLPAVESKSSRYLVVRASPAHASFYKPKGFKVIHSSVDSHFGNTFVYEKI